MVAASVELVGDWARLCRWRVGGLAGGEDGGGLGLGEQAKTSRAM